MNRIIINPPHISARVKCQVWSRICGYLRPVNNWNEGKKAEFKDRKIFNLTKLKEKKNDKM